MVSRVTRTVKVSKFSHLGRNRGRSASVHAHRSLINEASLLAHTLRCCHPICTHPSPLDNAVAPAASPHDHLQGVYQSSGRQCRRQAVLWMMAAAIPIAVTTLPATLAASDTLTSCSCILYNNYCMPSKTMKSCIKSRPPRTSQHPEFMQHIGCKPQHSKSETAPPAQPSSTLPHHPVQRTPPTAPCFCRRPAWRHPSHICGLSPLRRPLHST
jgi:hypothetical protein